MLREALTTARVGETSTLLVDLEAAAHASSHMRLPTSLSRRAALEALASAALLTSPPAFADDLSFAASQPTGDLSFKPPTFSLKGVPGVGSLLPGEAEQPVDLGVIGRGQNKDKTGRLNRCDKKGCISTFDEPDLESYIPPWTYQPGYSTQAISANDAMRQKLREEANLEKAASGDAEPPKPKKTSEEAYAELKAAIQAQPGATIVEEGDRYIRSEFKEGGATDDVEFLLSLDAPLVGYRSSARRGGDDKRQRNRIKEVRKSLKDKGWKSVGRQLEGV